MNYDSEIDYFDSLGSTGIDQAEKTILEDLNNQLLASIYEESALTIQEDQVKISTLILNQKIYFKILIFKLIPLQISFLSFLSCT